ncbi:MULTISPECIES: helix-turn-helix transcriptional regulator [unclassified Streptomyces]|uniref:helix-turn-helix transcriptional regulator n=1 Tax=unclassified Streptomyces TaxID=2593676 RepID=UPI002E7A3F53|nr:MULTISPECIES: WYL domain-containing protein [unclassified Streptomyces]MEE1758958.1 WYL domain-containing protein [Streptomyces sp. SP18BB07]MEE1833879.1 WYL domain-containing protein [Streptomyces sp. SP17KL33]
MLETSGRLLKLLALLQTHRDRDRSGAELAERLGVSRRTLRRDIERLRDLGYPVHAARGAAGYRLGAGASLPPLLLDDEEAVAVVVGLRTAAEGTVTGVEEASLRALTKLEQVLPSRLRHRVTTLHHATVRAGAAPAPKVSPDTLMAIAEACRRHERLRFDYAGPHTSTPDPSAAEPSAPDASAAEPSTPRVRTVEPHSLVSFDRHWYLVAWDTDRADWRTFRVDRLVPRTPTGPRFVPRALPDGDAATYLAHRLSSRAWPFRATVTLHEPAASVAERLWPGMGVLEPLDDDHCLLHLGAETPRDLAWMITSVDADFTLDASAAPELADALRAQAERSLQAIRRP